MSPGKDDKAIQRMMRGAAGASARPAADCPESEILAAFYERSLDPLEQKRYEEHFSQCAVCQEQLAALVRSDPHPETKPAWAWLTEWRPAWGSAAPAEVHAEAPALAAAALIPAATVPGRKSRWAWFTEWHYAWRWLVPAGAIAASLAIWVVVRSPQPDLSRTVAYTKTFPVATPAPANPAEPSKDSIQNASPAIPPAGAANKPVNGRRNVPLGQPLAKKSDGNAAGLASGRASKGAPAAGTFSQDRLSQRVLLSRPDESRSAKTDAAAEAMEKEAKKEKAVASDRMTAAPAAPSAPPSPSAASSEVVAEGRVATPPPKMKQAANERAAQARISSSLAFSPGEGLNWPIISSRDGKAIWRVGPTGVIERTADNGQTWQGQFLNEKATLLAGSSPSAKICWIVGASGTVLRTTDGERWEKVAAPADVNLVGVTALDAKRTTVLAADGRNFSTKDGGQTWELVKK